MPNGIKSEWKGIGETPFTLITGPKAVGKSSYGESLRDLAGTPCFIFLDTSKIIRHHKTRGTPIGKEFERFSADQKAGKILDCPDLILRAIDYTVCEIKQDRKVNHVVIAGSPRDVEQSKLWRQITSNVRLIHREMTLEQVWSRIEARQAEGIFREDDEPDAVKKAMSEYEEKVIPAAHIFNGQSIAINDDIPFRKKLEMGIEHMLIPDSVKKKMLRRLNTGNHPVSIKADEIDLKSKTNPKITTQHEPETQFMHV